MFTDTQAVARTVLAANAVSGRVAEGSLALMRKVSSSGDITVREGGDFVSLSIRQTSTKEVSNGKRTLVRVDREANGDIPAASAYLVVVGSDTVNGRTSALSALKSLLTSLCFTGDAQLPIDITYALASAITLTGDAGVSCVVEVDELAGNAWLRLLRGEA